VIYRYRLHDHDNFKTRSINGQIFSKDWVEFNYKIDFGPFESMIIVETKENRKSKKFEEIKPDISRMGKTALVEYIMSNREDLSKEDLRQKSRKDLLNISEQIKEK